MKQNAIMMTTLNSKRGLSPIVAGQIGKMSLLLAQPALTHLEVNGKSPFSL